MRSPRHDPHASPRATGQPAPSLLTPVWDASLAYDAYRERLFATVVRSTRDADLAEDIVQEAFLELIRAGQRGDLPDNELAWLHRVAANRVVDWSRKRARWAGHVPPSEDAEEPPETAILRNEARYEVRTALDRLPLAPATRCCSRARATDLRRLRS